METILYYACGIEPKTGKISRKLSNKPMTKDDAESFLKRHYGLAWLKGEAIPQPVAHHYFRG